MKVFEIGKEYNVRSVCDHECVWTFKVIERTAKTVTISEGGEIKKCRINAKLSEYRKAETVLPFGSYSMCPVLSAE